MELKTETIVEFFREKLDEVGKRQNVPLQDGTQFYLVNLLSNFVDVNRLHSPEKPSEEEPLAIMFVRALNAGNPNEQFRLFKSIGDKSLYVSGFFGDSFNRKIIDVDYYISMGENAYGSVSQISRESPKSSAGFTSIFTELAEKFPKLVDLLSEISEDAGITSNSDLLRLYERWLKTKSDRLSAKLREQGIAPIICGTEPVN
jgi:hypothetical protein